jgi:hypothetical protein
VVIPSGAATANVIISPLTNAQPVGNKTVALSIASDPAYTVGNLSTAKVTVSDTPINNWRFQYFGNNATNASLAGDNASPAGDGVPNIMKYALGLNPTQPTAEPLFAFGIDTNGNFGISYTRPDPPPADIAYNVDASDDLTIWCTNSQCVSAPIIVIHTNNTATVTSESDSAVQSSIKKFLRLNISRK